LTSHSCSDILTDPSTLVSCNYSGIPGNTGANGATAFNSQGPWQLPFNAEINVNAGETYAIVINNQYYSPNGYNIDFSASTATIFDNIKPHLEDITATFACNDTIIPFNTSEFVRCAPLANNNFKLTGPAGNYTVKSFDGVQCAMGSAFDNTFGLLVSPPLTGGSYTLTFDGTLMDLCGNTTLYDTLEFTINTFNVNVSKDNPSCSGIDDGWAKVAASGAGTFTYQWSQGSTTDSIGGLPSGNYAVTVTNQLGCSYSTTVTIDEPDPLVVTAEAEPVCEGVESILIATVQGGEAPYSFTFSGDAGLSAVSLPVGQTGFNYPAVGSYNYTVDVVDRNGCTGTASAQATVLKKPFAGFVMQEESQGTYGFRDTSLFSSFSEWYFGDGQQSLLPYASHYFAAPGVYTITLIASNMACSDTAYESVSINFENTFYFPNTFSPNGDGKNDVFNVYGTGIRSFSIRIFNRWGEEIFTSHDIVYGWDGRDSDKRIMQSGVYSYISKITDMQNRTHTRTGTVHLMR
jgi:gliding motility-associated-like protein